MTDRDPVAYLRIAHARAEVLAEAATPGPWFATRHDWGDHDFAADIGTDLDPGRFLTANVVGHGHEGGGVVEQPDADFIAANSPDTVLARITTERQILAWHRIVQTPGYDDYGAAVIDVCRDCSGRAPCKTVRLLAAGWGWTEEERG